MLLADFLFSKEERIGKLITTLSKSGNHEDFRVLCHGKVRGDRS